MLSHTLKSFLSMTWISESPGVKNFWEKKKNSRKKYVPVVERLSKYVEIYALVLG